MNKQAIQSCLKLNHKLLIAHTGPSSSMSRIELLLLDMILQLSDMNAPVTCREGLELVISLVTMKSIHGRTSPYIKIWIMKVMIRTMTKKSLERDGEKDFVDATRTNYLQKRLSNLTASMMTGAQFEILKRCMKKITHAWLTVG